jgi:hypothetical protein
MVDLGELERELSALSHDEQAIWKIQSFCSGFRNTKARMEIWNAENAIVRRPIDPALVRAIGFDTADDNFALLQGDIIRSDAAYCFGERITGYPKYAVLNSSCDLVPGRSKSAMLLRVIDIQRDDAQAKEKLSQLLKFTRRDSMYIPPLPDDPPSVAGSLLNFDGVHQIRSDDLFLSTRVASLSLIGWRVFASFSRVAIARASHREVEIRTAVQRQGCSAANPYPC